MKRELYIELDKKNCIFCIVYFDKQWRCEQFINFVQKEFNQGMLLNTQVELWMAKDDGTIMEETPPIDSFQILSKIMFTKYYLKIIDKKVNFQMKIIMAESVSQSMASMISINDALALIDSSQMFGSLIGLQQHVNESYLSSLEVPRYVCQILL